MDEIKNLEVELENLNIEHKNKVKEINRKIQQAKQRELKTKQETTDTVVKMLTKFEQSNSFPDTFKLEVVEDDKEINTWIRYTQDVPYVYFFGKRYIINTISEVDNVINELKLNLVNFVSILRIGQQLKEKYKGVEVEIDSHNISYIRIKNHILRKYLVTNDSFDEITMKLIPTKSPNKLSVKLELKSSFGTLYQEIEHFKHDYRVYESLELDSEEYEGNPILNNDFSAELDTLSINDIPRVIEGLISMYKKKSTIYKLLEQESR